MIEKAKTEKYEKILIVGILTRKDLGYFFECKRIAINLQLRKICEEYEAEFLEFDFYKDRDKILWKDGLQLNNVGADKLGRRIYKEIGHLNLSQGGN